MTAEQVQNVNEHEQFVESEINNSPSLAACHAALRFRKKNAGAYYSTLSHIHSADRMLVLNLFKRTGEGPFDTQWIGKRELLLSAIGEGQAAVEFVMNQFQEMVDASR